MTGLIRNIERQKENSHHSPKSRRKLISTMEGGKDFLFLFDLLAHTCGLESTLRVLTHSDDTFYLVGTKMHLESLRFICKYFEGLFGGVKQIKGRG